MSLLRRVVQLIVNQEFWLLWAYGVPLLISSSLSIKVLSIGLATIPVFWFARRIERGAWTIATPLDLPLVLWCVLGIVAVAVSTQFDASLHLYAELVAGVALYYGIVNGLSPARVEYGFLVLLILGLGLGVLGAFGLRYVEKFYFVPFLYSLMPKLDLTFLNPRGFTPNIVAGAIAPVIPVAVGYALTRKNWQRIGVFVLALFLFTLVVFTQSRGALLGLAVAFAILLVWRVPRLMWLAPLVALAMVAIVVWFGPVRVVDFLVQSDSSGSAGGRLELWSRALYILQDFPFTGIGLGTFQQIVPVLYPLFVNDPSFPLPHAHNMYLQMGVDYGIGGMVAFLGLVTTILLTGFFTLRTLRGTKDGLLLVGLFAGYVVYLVHGLLDAVAVSTKVSVVIWFLLALMVLMARRVELSKVQ